MFEGVGQGRHQGDGDGRVALGREHRVPPAELTPVLHRAVDVGAQEVGDRQRTALGNPHYPSLFPLQERFPRLGPREHAKGDVYEEDT